MVDYLGLKLRHVDSTDTGGSSYAAACRPRRGGDRRRQVQGRADHARRPPARRRHGDRHGAARLQPGRARRRVRVSVRPDHRQHVRDVRDAAHARVRHHQRAARLDQGRGLASRPAQSACDAARRRHGRGGGQLADDRRPAAPARLLRDQRRRRRDHRHQPGGRQEPEAPAREDPRRRRSAEAPDGRPAST